MIMPFEWLVQLVPPLKTRAFSISSSPSVHPNQVHLTVSIVSWITPFKRTRHGLCSSWLAGLDPCETNGKSNSIIVKECFIKATFGDSIFQICKQNFTFPLGSLEVLCHHLNHQCLSFSWDQEQDVHQSGHLWRSALNRT